MSCLITAVVEITECYYSSILSVLLLCDTAPCCGVSNKLLADTLQSCTFGTSSCRLLGLKKIITSIRILEIKSTIKLYRPDLELKFNIAQFCKVVRKVITKKLDDQVEAS